MMDAILHELHTFFSEYKTAKYKKREIMLRPDDTPSCVFYLLKGYVRLYALSEAGEELTLIIFLPGDVFPLNFILGNIVNKYYLEALGAVEVKKIPPLDFSDFVHKNPQILFKIISKVLIRFTGVLERMEYLVFGNSYQKVASILFICAQRFGVKKNDEILIQVPLTHKDIGLIVGLTRETVSIEVKKLERKKLIRYLGRLIAVENLEKLKTESLLTPSK